MKKTVELAVQTREASVSAPADPESLTFPITWTTGAAVKRTDFWSGNSFMEELCCDPAAVRMDRMRSGAPLLDTHNRYDLSGILGVIEDASLDGARGTANMRFSKRADVMPIVQDVRDGIIRNVSVGYKVYRMDDVSTAEDLKAGTRRMRAMDWEPVEVSLVPVGADAGAGVGRAEAPKNSCEIEINEQVSERSENQGDQSTAGHDAAPPAQRGGVGHDSLRRRLDLMALET